MQAILSNNTRKLIWFKSTKMLIAVLKIFFVLFIIIFGTFSFPMRRSIYATVGRPSVCLFVCLSVCLILCARRSCRFAAELPVGRR